MVRSLRNFSISDWLSLSFCVLDDLHDPIAATGGVDEVEQGLHPGFDASQFLHHAGVVLGIFDDPFGLLLEDIGHIAEVGNRF
jgi:hypothetical protein